MSLLVVPGDGQRVLAAVQLPSEGELLRGGVVRRRRPESVRDNAKRRDWVVPRRAEVTRTADLGIDQVMSMFGGPRVRAVPGVTLVRLERRAGRRRVGSRPGAT